MRNWEQLRLSVGFAEADEQLLRQSWIHVEEHADGVIDRFYDRIDRDPIDRAVLFDEAQVQRLKATLRTWIEEMVRGPWDDAYYQRRLRIGQVHVRVGLPYTSMFVAMNGMRGDLQRIYADCLQPEIAFDTGRALARITDLELAVMTATFMASRERRELQSLQDLIIANLPITVLCLDRRGGVTSSTLPAPRPLRPGEVLPLGAYLSAEIIEAGQLEQQVARALEAGRELTIPRFTVGTGNEERFLRATLVPLRHELAHVLLHIEELTDVIQAEARLQQAEALARIGSLAANLAHEIRNPLTAISSTLQVLTRTFDEGDRRAEIMTRVQEQVFRLDRLVTDLLSYARPPRTHLERIDPLSLCAQAISDSGVETRLVEHAPVSVLADAQYVLQILVNLLQNARDAGGKTVELHCIAGGIIEVRDDGSGVAPELEETLFDPFVTSKMRGTGLGLAISRKLALAMGGSLILLKPGKDAETAARGGATFRLVLPVSG